MNDDEEDRVQRFIWHEGELELVESEEEKLFDPEKHPREPAGSPEGGEFTSGGGGGPKSDEDMRLVGSGVDLKRVEDWQKDHIVKDEQ